MSSHMLLGEKDKKERRNRVFLNHMQNAHTQANAHDRVKAEGIFEGNPREGGRDWQGN